MSKKPAKGKTQAWPKEQTRDAARLRSAIRAIAHIDSKTQSRGQIGPVTISDPSTPHTLCDSRTDTSLHHRRTLMEVVEEFSVSYEKVRTVRQPNLQGKQR
jgi:hypothetical protein